MVSIYILALVVLFTVTEKILLNPKIDSKQEHFGRFIFYNLRNGFTQHQCINELNLIFDDEAPSGTSVYRWYGEFNRRYSSFQDEDKVVKISCCSKKILMCAN